MHIMRNGRKNAWNGYTYTRIYRRIDIFVGGAVASVASAAAVVYDGKKSEANKSQTTKHHTASETTTTATKTRNGFAIHIRSNYERKPLKMASG